MKHFIHHYGSMCRGVLSCFDRIVFKGCLPVVRAEVTERVLGQNGLRIKNLGNFVKEHSARIVQHAKTAENAKIGTSHDGRRTTFPGSPIIPSA